MAFILGRSVRIVRQTQEVLTHTLGLTSAKVSKNIHFSPALLKDTDDMDDLQKNPYFDKYADKIAKLQKTSPEEFLNRMAQLEEEKKKGASKFGGGGSGAQAQEKDVSLPTKPKQTLDDVGTGMTKERKLNDVMKTELLKDKSKEEIAQIWREYFLTKDAVAAVIPADMYAKMKEKFKEFKTFLFPLPRKQGYEFIVVQFAGNEAHFTTLINFQAFKENAPECLTLVHYTELAEEKEIVLMVGEFDKNVLTRDEASSLGVQVLLFYGGEDVKKVNLLRRFTYNTSDFNPMDLVAELETIQEAQCLANQVEMYYCTPSDEKLRLLHTFTHKPNEFKHSDLISQMENISLLTEKN